MKKKLILLFSMMLCIMSLVGCGGFKKPTVEEVLEKMQTKMEDTTSMESTLLIDIEMTMASQGIEASMNIDGEFDFEVLEESDDESTTHISGTMTMDAMDEVIEEEFESYTVIDGDEVVTYSATDGYWIKEVSEYEEDDDDGEIFDFSDFEEDLKLEDDIEKYNGVDCYVLKGKVDSESLNKFPTTTMDSMTGMLDDSVDMYLTIFINKKSYELAGFVVSAESFEEESDGITVSLDKMVMEFKIEGIDSVDKIKIPKSVLDAASNESYIYFEDDYTSDDFDSGKDDFSSDDFDFSFGNEDDDSSSDDVVESDKEEDSKKPDKEETQQQSGNEDASTSLDEKDKDTPSGNVETNEGICTSTWTDMKFMFEGKELHLPDPYSNFEVNGWYFSPEENGVTADYVLNANEYSIGITSLSNDKYDDFEVDVNIGFSNPNSSTTKLTDCNVWTFSADVYYAMKNSSKYPSMSVNGLQFGDSEDKLLEKLGTDYYSTYHSDSLGYTTYEYQVDYDLYFELCVYPDYGITEMSLKSYP